MPFKKGEIPKTVFKKGQSGNPKGRPKEIRAVRELARQWTEVAINTLAEICQSKSMSPAARVSAAQALLDRGYGKPMQSIELTGTEGGPLALQALPTDPVEAARTYQRLVGGGDRPPSGGG